MSLLHPKNSNDAINNIRKSTDALLNSAEKAFESGTEIASDAIHNRMEPVVDLMAVTAQKLAKQSMEMATDAKEYAQHAINHASKASKQYVAEQPVRSVLMAAAVGAAVAVLVTTLRSRNSVQRF